MSAPVLLVENDASDVFFLKRAFADAGLDRPLEVASTVEEAVKYLSGRSATGHPNLPILIIVDLKMPRREGGELLEWLRAHPVLGTLRVLVFSTSSHRVEIERAYRRGASGFVVKPASTGDRAEFARFLKTWLRWIEPPLASSEGYAAAEAFAIGRGDPS